MARGPGPTQVSPASMTAGAKPAFSAIKPQPDGPRRRRTSHHRCHDWGGYPPGVDEHQVGVEGPRGDGPVHCLGEGRLAWNQPVIDAWSGFRAPCAGTGLRENAVRRPSTRPG